MIKLLIWIFTGIFLATLCACSSENECGPVVDKPLRSPSGIQMAHIVSQYCASSPGVSNDPYWVVIGDEVAAAGQSSRVVLAKESEVAFKTWNSEPSINWADEQHITITINQVSQIEKSLHTIGNVTVSYSVSDALSEDNFLKMQNQYRREMQEKIQNHTVSLSRDPERGLQLLDHAIEAQSKEYQVFRSWVKENAK